MTDLRPLVVHVLFSFRVGGLENGVANLINHLPAERFRHVVVALDECSPSFCARVARDDVEFVSLRKGPGHGVKLYPRLFRLFRELQPAIVHTRNLAALEASVPAWAAGVPVRVHGEHGWDYADPDGRRLRYQLARRCYRPFVSHYIALSRHLSAYLTERVGVPATSVSRICNGVDTVRFHPARDGRAAAAGAPCFDSDSVIVGTVGRLQTVKDQLNLVRAFALAAGRGGPAAARLRLVVVGDGPLRAEIEAEVARAGLAGRVWMAGERADVAELMRSMDVFALPSRAEGISNTILEAMACGLPVVATAVGGNPELVAAGETGALVPAQDPVALADVLHGYATEPERARREGLAGRRRVEADFSLDGMVGGYAGLYERLLDGAGRRVATARA